MTMIRNLTPYKAPVWAKCLTYQPKMRLELATKFTPIHRWFLRSIPESVNLSIKRDDLTGSSLSGNKVRKLEFLMADAVSNGCSHVITCGGIQSNHCRSTVIAATEIGLKTHLLLRSDNQDPDAIGCDGNLLLNRLCGAEMFLVPRGMPETQLIPRMKEVAKSILTSTGGKSCIIPVGGSNVVGLYGYISAFEELMHQGVLDDYDDIVVTCGSGGTAAGLAISNYLTGAKLRIHAINICDDAKYFHDYINRILFDVGLGSSVCSEDIIDMIDGYKGQGYSVSTTEELEFIGQVAQESGIILDPTYTGKAVCGLVKEINSNMPRFKGNRILFIHTGGIFGMMDGRMNKLLKNLPSFNNIKVYERWKSQCDIDSN